MFYVDNINVSQRVSIPANIVINAIDDVSYLVYACNVINTMRQVNRDTPYFNIKKLAGFGDVVSLNDMKAIKENYMTRIFVFQKTTRELISTASHSVVFGERPNYISDRHCQEGQNAFVYDLKPNVAVVCGAQSAGKSRRTRRGKPKKYTRRASKGSKHKCTRRHRKQSNRRTR